MLGSILLQETSTQVLQPAQSLLQTAIDSIMSSSNCIGIESQSSWGTPASSYYDCFKPIYAIYISFKIDVSENKAGVSVDSRIKLKVTDVTLLEIVAYFSRKYVTK